MTKESSKWTYKVTNLFVDHFENPKGPDEAVIKHLNEMGKEGWELVDKELQDDILKIGHHLYKFVFKKPIERKS